MKTTGGIAMEPILSIHCIESLPKIEEDAIKRFELTVQELLSQFGFDDCSTRPAFGGAAWRLSCN